MDSVQGVLASLQSLVSMAALQKSMGEDVQTMSTLVSDMQTQTASMPPHTGKIDVLA